MFEAGIETDTEQIKKCGIPSLIITVLGVVFPLGLGFLVAFLMYPSEGIYSSLFYGVILTATSVSVTIACLKELGKLNSKVGTSIVSAAIIDDIIGVIILSVVTSLANANSASSSTSSTDNLAILWVVLKTISFFVATFVVGFIIRKVLKWLEKRHPHTQRLPIFALAICFFYAFAAEKWFGIADITGAYLAGLTLSKLHNRDYIDRRAEQASYMLFSPIFFAMIPIKNMFNTGTSNIDGWFILFGVLFIIAGIVGKLLGAGIGAKLAKYSLKDSYRVGLGMMCRAEVCLVCATKGVEAGLVNANIMIFIILLILITSFVTPILLKLSYRNEPTLVVDDTISKNDQSLDYPSDVKEENNKEGTI
jgi:Kef-type K+ transport system membrane component KefB